MTEAKNSRSKPPIILSDVDYARLSDLAAAALDRLPGVAGELQAELNRAELVSARAIPDNVVQMGSTVAFRSDTSGDRRVTLVYPSEADIAANRISILTPIGTALIGLATGQSMRWTARDGRGHELTVVAVEQPATASVSA